MNKKQQQKIYEATIDIVKVSDGLHLSVDKCILNFQDGRTASKFTEEWSTKIYGTTLATNSNQKGYDVVGSLDSDGSVKCITKLGVAFRLSSNTGKGRTCTPDDVKRAIQGVDHFVLVDIVDMPSISFIKISSGVVMGWYADKKIRKDGSISRKKLYELLESQFEVKREKKSL